MARFPVLSTPVAVLLQIRLDAGLHALLLRSQGPRLIDVAGWHIGVLERLATEQVCQTSVIVVSGVFLRFVIPYPSSDLEEAYSGTLRVLLDGTEVGIVEFFSVQEAGLLQNTDSLESLSRSQSDIAIVCSVIQYIGTSQDARIQLTSIYCALWSPGKYPFCPQFANTLPERRHLRAM